jgi:hypothetical protein
MLYLLKVKLGMQPMNDNNFGFFIASMPSSRPADYYLGCLDGSVFIDFNNSHNNHIYLTRISFDGYGCCDIGDQAKPMDAIDSNNFKRIIYEQKINQNELSQIIKKTICNNKDLLWEDALIEYKLI